MLEDLKPQTLKPSCKIRDILEDLEEADRQILVKYLLDWETWSANGLSKALATKDIRVGANTITKHRGSVCSC